MDNEIDFSSFAPPEPNPYLLQNMFHHEEFHQETRPRGVPKGFEQITLRSVGPTEVPQPPPPAKRPNFNLSNGIPYSYPPPPGYAQQNENNGPIPPPQSYPSVNYPYPAQYPPHIPAPPRLTAERPVIPPDMNGRSVIPPQQFIPPIVVQPPIKKEPQLANGAPHVITQSRDIVELDSSINRLGIQDDTTEEEELDAVISLDEPQTPVHSLNQ